MVPLADERDYRVNVHRLQVVASIGTRLALGAYPLAFIVVFGWAYGKEAFDVAAAAINWANYLNVFLLGGFAMVPPAIARLRIGSQNTESASRAVRDHIALQNWLIAAALFAALVLWMTIERAFPALVSVADNSLASWYVVFAAVAVAQLPLTLWLGVAQAAGRYRHALLWVAAPRALAILAVLGSSEVKLSPTAAIAVSAVLVICGQLGVTYVGRNAIREVDPTLFHVRGTAASVLQANFSAGLIALVGTLVTIVPVTLVGRELPSEVGTAHLMVTMSNAFGAFVVAAFFPASLTLARREPESVNLVVHSAYVARRVGVITLSILLAGWILFYPVCNWLTGTCSMAAFGVGSLVIAGAGLRLGSLGAYHGALCYGRPHVCLLSAIAEAIVVLGIMQLTIRELGLLAIGVAFVVGGSCRLLLALAVEVRILRRTNL